MQDYKNLIWKLDRMQDLESSNIEAAGVNLMEDKYIDKTTFQPSSTV